jgi:hypothetical protein
MTLGAVARWRHCATPACGEHHGSAWRCRIGTLPGRTGRVPRGFAASLISQLARSRLHKFGTKIHQASLTSASKITEVRGA